MALSDTLKKSEMLSVKQPLLEANNLPGKLWFVDLR